MPIFATCGRGFERALTSRIFASKVWLSIRRPGSVYERFVRAMCGMWVRSSLFLQPYSFFNLVSRIPSLT